MALKIMDGHGDDGGFVSLLCVSRVAVEADRLEDALAAMHTASLADNTRDDITGLLVATSRWVMQLLEGPGSSLDAVMDRVRADVRQADVRVLRHVPIARRGSGSWRFLRIESGAFEQRHVTPLLEQAYLTESDASVAALMGLCERLRMRLDQISASSSAPQPAQLANL